MKTPISVPLGWGPACLPGPESDPAGTTGSSLTTTERGATG